MRKMLFFIAGLIAVVLFSGCAPKSVISEIVKKNFYYHSNRNIYLASTSTDSIKNKWAFQLQEVSEYGLKHGWRYFAITKPNRISNTIGSSFNTFEDINRFCSNNSFDCGKNSVGDLYWEIEYFKKQPIKYVTFDAKAIIRDLKHKGLYLDKVPEGTRDLRFNEEPYDQLRKRAPF